MTLPPISVSGGLAGSAEGRYSTTLPLTRTRFPTAAAEGGAEEVKTRTPSEVAGSASASPSGAWR